MANVGKYTQQILDYYDKCWLERFTKGHNPNSLAMHMGYFRNSDEDNDQAKLQMNSFVLSLLDLEPNEVKTIVDAGCGIGGTLFYLKQRFSCVNLIGINISKRQIEYAKQQSKHGNDILFLEENYSNTSLESNSVDIVYAIESACHSESKTLFLNELNRILKPGGKLFIIDYIQKITPSDEETYAALHAFQQGWAVNHYIDNPEERLKKAGFNRVKVTSILSFVMPGIKKSHDGALRKMDRMKSDDNELMLKHFNACVSLKLLADKKIIDYCVLQGSKPSIDIVP